MTLCASFMVGGLPVLISDFLVSADGKIATSSTRFERSLASCRGGLYMPKTGGRFMPNRDTESARHDLVGLAGINLECYGRESIYKASSKFRCSKPSVTNARKWPRLGVRGYARKRPFGFRVSPL